MISNFINILIFTLIIVFILILKQQLFIPDNKIEKFDNNNKNTNNKRDNHPYKLKEALSNDAFELAQQNAGNINVLKNRVENLEVLKNQVMDNSNKIKLLEEDLEQILQDQINMTLKKRPPNISGFK